MGEKIERARKLRAELSDKWYQICENGEMTIDKIKEMKEDDKILKKVSKEANAEFVKDLKAK